LPDQVLVGGQPEVAGPPPTSEASGTGATSAVLVGAVGVEQGSPALAQAQDLVAGEHQQRGGVPFLGDLVQEGQSLQHGPAEYVVVHRGATSSRRDTVRAVHVRLVGTTRRRTRLRDRCRCPGCSACGRAGWCRAACAARRSPPPAGGGGAAAPEVPPCRPGSS